MNDQNIITELKDVLQDCNINFLLGSGMSAPYLPPLGDTELLLTKLAEKKEKGKVGEAEEKIVRASLYKRFFDDVIVKNLEIIKDNTSDDGVKDVAADYEVFLKTVNSIVLNRKSTILNKQVNLFTTNIDLFLDKCLESIKVEYNDGFSGRFNPLFDLTNFKKSLFKTSLHYDNTSELTVFNLMKMHGSLTWGKGNKKADDIIAFSHDLRLVKKLESIDIPDGKLIKIEKKAKIDDLVGSARGKRPDAQIDKFITEYEKLAIVNPTKEKFRETVLNRNYYELLRIYSGELEKENTVLFVAGFSFADEHIREVTIRVVNSNPTLKVYIFSYSGAVDKGIEMLKAKSNNNNVEIVVPPRDGNRDGFKYDFKSVNDKIFRKVLNKISQEREMERA